MKLEAIRQEFSLAGRNVTIETREIARQATSAVMVDIEGTTVFVTCVASKDGDPKRDFLPLTVDYQERTYAAGKIPGGFFRREGRPSEHEILVSRLIDRPVRPLFDESFTNEIQIVATVMSVNPQISTDIVALIGVSAVLSTAGLPFNGPIGAVRVGYINGNYVTNPTRDELKESDLDLVVAGTEGAVLMVESEANLLSEEVMLGAVMHGHNEMQTIIENVKVLAQKVNAETFPFVKPEVNRALIEAVEKEARVALEEAFTLRVKKERSEAVSKASAGAVAALTADADNGFTESEIAKAISNISSDIVRGSIIKGNPRIDGRDTRTVRPIEVKVDVLERTHGSALFTRGETQAIVVVTLGTERDAQIIDAIDGEYHENFMFHYNFPPYSVGEVGRVGSPKRREIGHGRLAKRGVQAVLPDMSEYPYTIRVVSEITESNGSSSMASVCGSSLALMDAGVPLKAPVAGVAMGLIKEGDDFAVLTDILGDEDHLGDMDFKVAGTETGITALQMDIKINGITKEIMEKALAQAKEGRLHILGEMNKVISQSRESISEYAPRITTIRINPDRIRDVIGKGGVTIRAITEETGAIIEIEDSGEIRISAVNNEQADAARKRIEEITSDIEIGSIYEAPVVRVMDFGAFVNLRPGQDGMVHVSQIPSDERIQNASDHLKIGQIVKVKVLEIDRQGRIRLSMKDIE